MTFGGSHRVYELVTQILYEITKKWCCSYLKNIGPIRSQFCTCHDCSGVVTCSKLWSCWTISIMITAKKFFTKYQLLAHKPLAEWVRLRLFSKRWGILLPNLAKSRDIEISRDLTMGALMVFWHGSLSYRLEQPPNKAVIKYLHEANSSLSQWYFKSR